jgi:hypothetical protein
MPGRPAAPRSSAVVRARLLILLAILAPALAACNRTRSASAAPGPPTHVDSVVPRDVALARFRSDLDSVDALAGGLASRDALVRRFVHALQAHDTAALAALSLTAQEFAWIYYPANPQGLPPYDLSPQLMWFLLQENSRKGLLRALEERGGRSLGFLGYRCDSVPSREGRNTVWGPCTIRRVQAPGDTVEERLFGPILQRGGRFKFVSLANKF